MPFIIASVNVNGVRAASGKGMLDWLANTEADVVCLQETRATDAQTRAALAPVLDAWHLSNAEPGVKGRAGVAILSRRAPRSVRIGFGSAEFDLSGRYLQAEFDELTVASVYVPTGDPEGTPRQDAKYRYLAELGAHLDTLTGDAVIVGDWNIAHTERDIKAWRANRKSSGFLPRERAWIDGLLARGWVDVVRRLHPDVDGPYSWWSYRGRAFDNDAGWRIDYHLARGGVADKAKQALTERAAAYDLRWSDHAPVTVQYR